MAVDEVTAELNERFTTPNNDLAPEIVTELKSIMRLHSVDPQELYFKWESYSMQMGAEETMMNLKTVRDFKKHIQDMLERESRGKTHARGQEKKSVGATPRSGGGDVYGMLDGLVPNTPRPGAANSVNGSTIKRKSNFDTPAAKSNKSHAASSPNGTQTPATTNGSQTIAFADRTNAGDILDQFNGHIDISSAPSEGPSEPRVKLKANTEFAKSAYKTMAMKLSEASTLLDDRIDEFQQLVKEHHSLEDSVFGNPAGQSTSEIVAVGRIASDSSEGKLNTASLVLETSRRTGAGVRVPLKVEGLDGYEFFPGKIVALRGSNASGEFFTVKEILPLPIPSIVASKPSDLDVHNARLQQPSADDDFDSSSSTRPLTTIIASGPYTSDDSLDYSPLTTLLMSAATSKIDTLILLGPFMDVEHPSIRAGDFSNVPLQQPDTATLADVFRHYITRPLTELHKSLPTLQTILVPSVRDALAKHAAWPQDKLARKELGLPKGAIIVPNPSTFSINEITTSVSSLDILDMLRREELVSGRAKSEHPFSRVARQLIEQRHFCPVFPPTGRESLKAGAGAMTDLAVKGSVAGGQDGDDAEAEAAWGEALPVGAPIDTSYLSLGDWTTRPDLLISPSVLTPFVKVVESVVVVNPGTLSKRKGPGTYARLTVLPVSVTDEEREAEAADGSGGFFVPHKLYERARVDVMRI